MTIAWTLIAVGIVLATLMTSRRADADSTAVADRPGRPQPVRVAAERTRGTGMRPTT